MGILEPREAMTYLRAPFLDGPPVNTFCPKMAKNGPNLKLGPKMAKTPLPQEIKFGQKLIKIFDQF